MDVGLYVNLFETHLSTGLARLLAIERETYPDLRLLRGELEARALEATVYADGQRVYGYGAAADQLTEFGFRPIEIDLHEIPRVTSNMILEGFLARLEQEGFTEVGRWGRSEVFNFSQPIMTPDGKVQVYRGYDLRSLYLFDRTAASVVFGLVVDVAYTFRDSTANTLTPRTIATQFGPGALSQVRYVQGDLLPQRRINLEVSRQRLLDHIMPFVAAHASFELPCRIRATLRFEPTRILMVAGNRTR